MGCDDCENYVPKSMLKETLAQMRTIKANYCMGTPCSTCKLAKVCEEMRAIERGS